jgi:hypothetical protein
MNLTPHQALTICQELLNVQEANDTNIHSYEVDWLTEDSILFSANRIGIGNLDDVELVSYDYLWLRIDTNDSLKMDFYDGSDNEVFSLTFDITEVA